MSTSLAYLPTAYRGEESPMGDFSGGNKTVEYNFDPGQSYTGVRVKGTIVVQEGSKVPVLLDMAWGMVDNMKVYLNGDAIIDVSGYAFTQWLAFNRFADYDGSSIADENLRMITIPFFMNYSENSSKMITFLNTGAGTLIDTLSIKLTFKDDFINSDDGKVYAIKSGSLRQQSFTIANTPGNNLAYLKINSYSRNLTLTGKSEITTIPRNDTLLQLIVMPPEDNTVTASWATFRSMTLRVNQYDYYTSYNKEMLNDIKTASHRHPIRLKPTTTIYTDGIQKSMPEQYWCQFDQGLDGNGYLADGRTPVGINLRGVASFNIKLDVIKVDSSNGSAIEILTTSLAVLNEG